MALLDGTTLAADEQQDAARRLQRDKVDARREQQRSAGQGRRSAGASGESRNVEAAEAAAEQLVRRGWQTAQEVAEDTALSFADFLIISGPTAIILYAVRWIGGNLMGRLFTKRITPPLPYSLVIPSVTVPLVPGYSIADPLDHLRHVKIFLIAALTLVVWGFILILLYYVTHPLQAVFDSFKTLVTLLKDLACQFGLFSQVCLGA